MTSDSMNPKRNQVATKHVIDCEMELLAQHLQGTSINVSFVKTHLFNLLIEITWLEEALLKCNSKSPRYVVHPQYQGPERRSEERLQKEWLEATRGPRSGELL